MRMKGIRVRCQAPMEVERALCYNRVESESRRMTMPTYTYVCKDCNKQFTQMLTLSQHDRNKVTCPKCNSKKVEQKYAAFFAVSAKKS